MSEVEKVYDWFIQDSLSNIYKFIGKSEKDMVDCPCPIKQKIEGTERDRSMLPGIEKYLEEEIPEQEQDKPEIPHREQRIQWHKDSLHSLETGEKMREWEYRLVVGDGEWKICNDPHFSEKYEYRRKPRTVTYWHCVAMDNTGIPHVMSTTESRSTLERVHELYDQKKVSPIIETTVELED